MLRFNFLTGNWSSAHDIGQDWSESRDPLISAMSWGQAKPYCTLLKFFPSLALVMFYQVSFSSYLSRHVLCLLHWLIILFSWLLTEQFSRYSSTLSFLLPSFPMTSALLQRWGFLDIFFLPGSYSFRFVQTFFCHFKPTLQTQCSKTKHQFAPKLNCTTSWLQAVIPPFL